MTKLSKVPPPTYTGKSPTPGSLEAAVPYENMRQAAQPPVPVTTAVLPSSYNEPLPDTNPFSPNFKPGLVSNDEQPASIPVESMYPIQPSQAPVQTPTEQRKSIDLRRLDGKPYPNTNGLTQKEKPKVVKVARDMHDGALPPIYKRQAPEPVLASSNSTSPNAHGCGKCGKKRDAQSNGHSCKDCGKRRTTMPITTTPTPATPMNPSIVHARAVSESQTSQGSSRMSGQSTAGPSSSPSSSTHSRACNKCGRYKRPSPTSSPFDQGRPNGIGPATAPVPMAGHPAMRPGLSINPNAPGNNAAYPKINVMPASAATDKGNPRFSTYGDDSPLVGNATKQEFKLFRNSSLIRSLSRRLSRKDKQVAVPPPAPLPSQQLARQSGEQSAGNLINMISTAMQNPAHEREGQYAHLQVDRPETPFSFVGGKDEKDGFEMVDLQGDRPSISTQDSWSREPIAPQISVTHSDSDMVAGVPQDHIDVIPRPKSTGPQLLNVDSGDRPQITRFKSLRVGVQRMGSNVSRSTSLRRLGSLKTVHHAWYVEGSEGNNENMIAAF